MLLSLQDAAFPVSRLHLSPVLHLSGIVDAGLAINTHQLHIKLLSPPSKRSEWRRYCFRSMCVCLCVYVCAQRTGQSADQLKTVKATDFKFNMHVPRDSPDMTL